MKIQPTGQLVLQSMIELTECAVILVHVPTAVVDCCADLLYLPSG